MRIFNKYITLVLLFFIGLLPPLSAVTYEVETKYGVRDVVIPEGHSELQVLLTLAQYYYELDHEYNDLTHRVKELLSEIDEYKSVVSKYSDEMSELDTKYKKLIKDYDTLLKAENPAIRFLAGVNAELDSIGVGVGIQLLDKIQVTAFLNGLSRVQVGVTAVI